MKLFINILAIFCLITGGIYVFVDILDKTFTSGTFAMVTIILSGIASLIRE